MTIDAVAAPAATGMYTTTPTRAPKQTLDSEAFMSLLVTQLRNQDPSSPMDTNQMISQTTQLAMMEKLSALSTTADENFSLQMRVAAAALVGQDVTYTKADGTSATGTASAVSYAGKVPQVTINGTSIALDAISGVTAHPAATPTATA
ncbi:flagellar basal-body rod modification protein FlgD [Cryobacterium sp. MP_M5]|uniref:flagellar hook assembly protein FlgD n=1 Tax=unclassified Cryobacterium TaxID=2649013 RepID=UPI001A2622F3|nr:flagellar basal-body rod modification protein FlgD [Cryobacterium sp. MP_M3]MEC5176919.1 flagellar basal-body rod modification protein FlgD [Cryobacterium sp. MP_M5]